MTTGYMQQVHYGYTPTSKLTQRSTLHYELCRSGDLLCMKWAAFWIYFPSKTCFSWRIFMIVSGKSIQIFTWISTSLLVNQYLFTPPRTLFCLFLKWKKKRLFSYNIFGLQFPSPYSSHILLTSPPTLRTLSFIKIQIDI